MGLGPFGNDPQQVSVASRSLSYLLATQINIPSIQANGPAKLAQLYSDWQAAIRQVNATSPPGNPEPESAEQALWNAAAHALYWDYPVYFNAVQAWYEAYGTRAFGTQVPDVPTLPDSLKQFLS